LEYGYTARTADGGEAGGDTAGPSHVEGHPSPGVDDHGGAYTDRNTQSGPVEAGQGTPIYDDDIQNEHDRAPIASSSKRKGIEKGEEKVLEVSSSPIGSVEASTYLVFLQDVDSDELDDEDFVPAAKRAKVSAATSRAVSSEALSSASNTGLRGIGEFMPCGECSQRFTVVSWVASIAGSFRLANSVSYSLKTAYTKPHPTKPNAYVCFDCCTVLGIDPFAKTKKPAAKRAPAKSQKKDSRNKVISYEERKGAAKLAEMCIKVSCRA
jgi:DNA repair protein RAD7